MTQNSKSTEKTVILRLGLAGLGVIIALTALGSFLGLGRMASATATVAGDTTRIAQLGWLPEAVRESSGVAVSRIYPDIFWTHNDQGNRARLFAVSMDGTLGATFDLEGARVDDWEDIALGRCPEAWPAQGDCLYLADTGDNRRSREAYAILVLSEPDPHSAERSTVRVGAVVRFRFPDGSHDTEALAVDRDGNLMVVTKGQEGSADVYRLPSTALEGDQDAPTVLAERIGTLPIDVTRKSRRVTGAAISPDGNILAVRSDRSVSLFELSDLGKAPLVCEVRGGGRQGEAVDYLDSQHLLLTSEARGGGRAPIVRMRCP